MSREMSLGLGSSGDGRDGARPRRAQSSLASSKVISIGIAMAATIEVLPGDELFFEYRKLLTDGEPHKHRHSMLAVKRFETNPNCELKEHIAIYEHAHLLMLKVVRLIQPLARDFGSFKSEKLQNTLVNAQIGNQFGLLLPPQGPNPDARTPNPLHPSFCFCSGFAPGEQRD